MHGRNTCRLYLLLLACLWLVACRETAPPAAAANTQIELPVVVTRLVPQEVVQEAAQEVAAPLAHTTPCAPGEPGTSAVVTIGAILPLSSPGALLAGFAMQTALNIAVTDINEGGGINGTPLRLITYDSAGEAERAAHFAERLILLDCAVSIVGLYHNFEAMAVTDVAHRYGIPVIVGEAGADDITSRGYPEVFRIAPAYSMLSQIPAAWLREVGDYNDDGMLCATIIADNSASASTIVDGMLTNLVAAGIETELLRVELPSSDFSSAIARLVVREKLPDAIFISIKGDPALLLHSQLLDAGIGPARTSLIVQGHVALNSAKFWSELPNGNGTIVVRTGAWISTITQQGQDFVIKYDQYMGRWPESYAFAAYDSLWLLAEALRTAPAWHGSDLIATLERINAEVTSGQISFAHTSLLDNGSALPAYQWHQWLNSQVLYLQYTEPNQPASAMSVIWPPQHRAANQQAAVILLEP